MSVVASCMSTAKYNDPSFGSAPRSISLLAEIELIVDDGDHRRREAVAVGQLRIGAALDERGGDVLVPVARGKHQRREAAGGVVGVLPVVDGGDVTLAIGIRARRRAAS